MHAGSLTTEHQVLDISLLYRKQFGTIITDKLYKSGLGGINDRLMRCTYATGATSSPVDNAESIRGLSVCGNSTLLGPAFEEACI